MKRMFYVISDSLGETAMQVLKAALSQFDMDDYDIRRFSYVLDVEALEGILKNAVREDAVIIHTLVNKEMSALVNEYCRRYLMHAVDVLADTIGAISEVTSQTPKCVPGAIRKLNDKYYKRVEAIEFAVKYDDGKDPAGLLKADIVLIGISRTSKTPLSMYLANKNIKVANLPLVPEAATPREIYQVDPNRVVGLTNTSEKLMKIREERLHALGLGGGIKYADEQRINDEIEFARVIMSRIGCPVIDVSNKAIEETAEIILNIMMNKGINIYID